LQNKRILDIGCGVGYVGLLAALRGAEVVATEMHETNIKRAELVFESFGCTDRAKVIKSDMQTMSSGELGRFDAVLFLGTIYHCEYPLQVLESISEMSDVVVVDARLASAEQVNDTSYGLKFFKEKYSDDNPLSPIRRVGGVLSESQPEPPYFRY